MKTLLIPAFTLLTVAAQSLAQSQNIPQPSTHPIVCAHRGWLSPTQLENSVGVIGATVQAGVPMVEFDTRESSDGQIFLLHDTTLDRTTGVPGTIANYTGAQLSTVRQLDPRTHTAIEPLSTFNALLDLAQKNQVRLMVDLKSTPPADAVAALRRHGLIPRALLLTFDAQTTAAALASDPNVQVSILTSTPQQIDAAIAQAGSHPIALYLPAKAEPALYVYAHRTGKPVLTDLMDTIDPIAQAQGSQAYVDFLKTHPVDILVTNHPLEVQKALQGSY
jgi:glycerophosphoryl diester phosphodiesterase